MIISYNAHIEIVFYRLNVLKLLYNNNSMVILYWNKNYTIKNNDLYETRLKKKHWFCIGFVKFGQTSFMNNATHLCPKPELNINALKIFVISEIRLWEFVLC